MNTSNNKNQKLLGWDKYTHWEPLHKLGMSYKIPLWNRLGLAECCHAHGIFVFLCLTFAHRAVHHKMKLYTIYLNSFAATQKPSNKLEQDFASDTRYFRGWCRNLIRASFYMRLNCILGYTCLRFNEGSDPFFSLVKNILSTCSSSLSLSSSGTRVEHLETVNWAPKPRPSGWE